MDKTDIYRQVAGSFKDVEVKGAAMPYTSVNGNMFSFISKENELSIRLPEDVLKEVLTDHKGKISIQHGIVMKEYVVVPESFFKKKDLLKKYFGISLRYASGLKAKPAKKKTKKS
jgi:hypothetical protein